MKHPVRQSLKQGRGASAKAPLSSHSSHVLSAHVSRERTRRARTKSDSVQLREAYPGRQAERCLTPRYEHRKTMDTLQRLPMVPSKKENSFGAWNGLC